MNSRKSVLRPKEQRLLAGLGENIKLARLRRKLTTTQVAERANISRSSLWHIEKGSSHIGIGLYLQVLNVLGLGEDLAQVAKDDVFGRKLQDAKLLTSSKRKKKSES
ncbi:helix-turn-helix transcriptional regulator [Pontibacter sp. G13]|uniref:helix-turn-helix domain-containing protein n=1 Tax=Pontibacter sp. G13 TaxID=3074898 RepID=UPI0028899618|nr:helix-turn-helix transcriptional regulator [Pontibacter sp. G13]WNJ16633.1 helix-turn-helix transcriptional regulator [Pontibacter sp. G13]